MKKTVVISAAAITLSAVSIPLLQSTKVAAMAQTQQVILPAYKYPEQQNNSNDQYWKAVSDKAKPEAGQSTPMAIMNVNSGPGEKVDPNYTKQLAQNEQDGIKNLGYVRTGYMTKPMDQCKQEVEKWIQLYGDKVRGIMLDEITHDTPQQKQYLKEIYQYIKSQHPNFLVIANPGRHIPDDIAGYSDIFITAEMTADKYLAADYPPATSKFETGEANVKRNYHIVYNAKTSDYEKITKVSKERNAGYVFITNDEFPDPFNALPGDYNRMVDLANNGANKKQASEPKPVAPEKKPAEDKTPAAEPAPVKKDTEQKDQSTPSSTPTEEPKPAKQDSLADTGINSFLIAGGVVVLLGLGTGLIIFNKKRIAHKK